MTTKDKIRRELNAIRKKLITEGVNKNNALNLARKDMNDKYGKGWRESSVVADKTKHAAYPSFYEEYINGTDWMD